MSALSRPSPLTSTSVRGFDSLASASVLARSLPSDTTVPSLLQYYSHGYQVGPHCFVTLRTIDQWKDIGEDATSSP